MNRMLAVSTLILVACCLDKANAEGKEPLLLRQPTASRTSIAFSYAGDIWIVPRQGGQARKLTAGAGRKSYPFFSPDGKWIAYTADYYGNDDVFVISAEGDEPRRVTYHPGTDGAAGWTPDGARILFASDRSSANDPPKLFTAPFAGGPATQLPLPTGLEGSFSPDGSHIAYSPRFQWQEAWKRYRGGQTRGIWIAKLSDSSIEKIPRENSNDFNPMWIGKRIYFLSDRSGCFSLWYYDMETRKLTEAVHNTGLDFKSASTGPDVIVYEQFGSIHLFDPHSGKEHKIEVEISGEFPELLPHFEALQPARILHANISPTGMRAVFEAHGEILTVPANKGDIRNLTNSPAVADRDPAWSPDGTRIAYFSDDSGEYELHVREQTGLGQVNKYSLGSPPSFFYSPRWSPDGKKICYFDKRLNLWFIDLDKKTPVKVDTDYYYTPFKDLNPSWSPDSKWIAYTKQLKSFFHAVFVFNLETGKATRLTDGLSDARHAQWDKGGKYLYFTASTNEGLAADWLNMSSIDRPVSRQAYVAVLSKTDPSPLAPESDEEKKPGDKEGDAKKDADAKKNADAKPEGGKSDAKNDKEKPPTVKIDFDGLNQRVLALPIPARNYNNLLAGKSGEIYVVEEPQFWAENAPPPVTVQKFDMKTRKVEPWVDGASDFILSFDGEKALYSKGGQWAIAPTAQPAKPGDGSLQLSAMQVFVDPRAEWRQMYHEAWRIERDYLYDPNAHGLNLNEAENFYSVFLPRLSSRADLNYLFTEMLGNITLGHMFVRGGDSPKPPKVTVGLLGADYAIENNRYRFTKIYNGENWNPQAKAPLTAPGVDANVGDYLLAVNGRDLHGTDELYSFFQDTAGKQITIRVGPNQDGSGARDVKVVPVPSESVLRNLDWIESNRRKVDQMTQGRVAYVYLPDTALGGYANFNRYYFSQVGKEAVVLDERFNHGGDLADYIIDYLRRPVMSLTTSREGADTVSPNGIFGPKVMIINEFAGSGGDAMPWYFRKAGLGSLIGKRTWGGLVGILDYPTLIDGGNITAPSVAIFGLNGEWEVENRGISPDIEVEMDPKLVREGHDPQLEKAVDVVMQELKKHPLPTYKKPAYPDYKQRLAM